MEYLANFLGGQSVAGYYMKEISDGITKVLETTQVALAADRQATEHRRDCL